MNLEQLATLPLPSRIQAMEILWTSMDQPSAIEAPVWHAQALSDRRAEIDNGHFTDWEIVKARLKAKSTIH